MIIHQAENREMNFQKKNFSYVAKDFGNFVDEISAGQTQYLRSLSTTEPADSPANLAIDYPQIADDFRLPSELQMVMQSFHSSVLRISGPVIMWLHYDVRDPRMLAHHCGWALIRPRSWRMYSAKCEG